MKSSMLHISIVLSIILLSDSRLVNGLVSEHPRKFDEFGNVTCEDELARLDAFTVELQKTPESDGYIIVYGGRAGRRDEAKARAARMKFYLVRYRGILGKYIHTLDGGYRDNLTSELWLRRPGESAPVPSPTVKTTEVKLRGRVRVRGYYCGEGLG
jgi:hypothetical protein